MSLVSKVYVGELVYLLVKERVFLVSFDKRGGGLNFYVC